MMKVIIAITADSMVEPSRVINQNFADFAPRDLKEVIIEAGGIPIILPFPENVSLADEFAREAVRLFDGLIIPGGPDIDPTFFGEEPIREIGRTAYQRDYYEIALVKAARKANKPIFGICRGLQLINVAFGGTLYQDLAVQNLGSNLKHSQSAPGGFPTHHVKIDESSHLYETFGSEAYVNSRHHQAVKDLAKGFNVIATAYDGVVEAIESKEEDILAVQWHPENMWRSNKLQLEIFEHFVECCEKSKIN
ncbi:gamma-glutamyl-gamma-aminobutyrate hydrolase family protein [Lactococcus allomyrinae]|uniref:Gamma-glutamyl-gamma-aminobutyrate hydrolase family protein n=2 Tax=Lactococcus allomyrinae TaxID=2419773 RepID=A0A387BCI8_9LACT|nr:gamma-glutamyl-gamma-aminobutyrate hydrolase family protein [Lactococcus allomyrinae]